MYIYNICFNGVSISIANEIFLKRVIENNISYYRELASHRKPTSRNGLASVNYQASQL